MSVMEELKNLEVIDVKERISNGIFLEEEEETLEVAGTWGSLGTFGSSVGGCASSVGSASSFG